jgi:putative transposase
MKKSQFTEEQIAYALQDVEVGTAVAEICRELGVSEQTLYRWKRKFAGMGVAELRRLKQLAEDNPVILPPHALPGSSAPEL